MQYRQDLYFEHGLYTLFFERARMLIISNYVYLECDRKLLYVQSNSLNNTSGIAEEPKENTSTCTFSKRKSLREKSKGEAEEMSILRDISQFVSILDVK